MDLIRGTVTHVVDGDTFDMFVEHIAARNTYPYERTERVRIAQFDAPELYAALGLDSAYWLAGTLTGRRVECAVDARDKYGRLVCDVSLATL